MKTFLTQFHKIDNDILEKYISFWTAYEVSKHTIMTAPGEKERYLYFVLEGVQKSYYQQDGKQHIIAFAYPPSFSGIPESFFTQRPSRYFLECISHSQFLRIPFQKHQELMQEHREIERLFRKIVEHFLWGVIQRQHEIMALDMESRFKTFVQRSPHLLQLISQKDLASYLRISPTNFSKLMNSIHI